MSSLPVSLADVRAARDRIRPHVPVTPLRRYAPLEEELGYGLRVFVKPFDTEVLLDAVEALYPGARP